MIPINYRKQIIQFMGTAGEEWLDALENVVEKYRQQWEIDSFEVCSLSYNYVTKGISRKFGPVVMKVCLPGSEYETERLALRQLNRDVMCKLYAYDEADHVLLLEDISPGDDLWSVPYEARLAIAVPLISQTPTDRVSDSYPTHFQWLKRIQDYLSSRYASVPLLVHLNRVIELYDDLKHPENPVVLFHGDLHHGNIISDHTWRVVDPKGVIGFKSLEVGRYMNNQIQKLDRPKDQMLEDMVEAFSEGLKLPKRLILQSFYTDMVLSTSWFYEDDVVDVEAIKEKTKICDWLFGELNQIEK